MARISRLDRRRTGAGRVPAEPAECLPPVDGSCSRVAFVCSAGWGCGMGAVVLVAATREVGLARAHAADRRRFRAGGALFLAVRSGAVLACRAGVVAERIPRSEAGAGASEPECDRGHAAR